MDKNFMMGSNDGLTRSAAAGITETFVNARLQSGLIAPGYIVRPWPREIKDRHTREDEYPGSLVRTHEMPASAGVTRQEPACWSRRWKKSQRLENLYRNII